MSPTIGNNVINVITENRTGQLILGTNGGLIVFDSKTGEFSHLNYDPNNILNFEGVAAIWIDPDDTLWIGYLRSGLVRLNPKTNEYIHYRADASNPNSLRNNFIQYVYRNKKGHLWIAMRRGLNKFIEATDRFQRYTKDTGLPSNVIVGILEDAAGNLWLSSTNGLSKFNPEAETFMNYDVNDGLQGNQFWNRSCFKSPSGELFFGGNNGFNAFYPEKIEKLVNPYIPPIVITNVKILNQSPFQNSYAIKAGQNTLNLSYQENQISFEFAALDFTRPEKNQFAYMLAEIENDWIYAGTRRNANYTNLPPGDYVFKVKGTNSDGVWNEKGTTLHIHIDTPFWKTGWAYLLYGLLAIGLIYGINAYIIGMVRVRHDLKIERMEKEKVREINQFKLQFFTDVAHEFKTPLTLIQAPLEEILASKKNNFPYQTEFQLMYRNVKYLLRLVHQLLNFRKAEHGKMELKASPGDIVQFAREVFELFREMARKHQINYQFHSNAEVIEGWFDWEKIEEILVNLIDNAFKYTPDNECITVNLIQTASKEDEQQRLQISVTDSGTGISSDQLDHIFERFYQPREGHHSRQISSGLGLALTKRLVELHHGEIRVESQKGRGSCFTVILPLGKAHLAGHEIISDISETSHFHSPGAIPVDEFISGTTQQTDPNDENRQIEDFRVLIVEDDGELRAYIGNALSRKYKITLAKDGQEGVELAKKILPDLVISNVMMPCLDGIELCRQLKNDFNTSHIPIILLTARTMIEHKIEGIETGADDYIEKPFHFRFLEARITNLLKSREKLRECYRKELILEPAAVAAASEDEKFLIKIRKFIEAHLANPELDVKLLTRELGISRTMLFVKLKELIGYSPNELIKIIRLEKAAQFLTKTDLTIGEISDKVGFSYSKYFSTCFLEKFGMTPTEYRNREGG
jgi:signal transduction histidine kinase/DNA-binding response OmpR family regulator